ncbi:hypothetical protein GIB67_010542 [Kingdonia uniflora]|uniref:HAT C-terminal dimerisation domain-containing protein n=1 Tax=Kingdonia uniflora TaxID=39325 RepID=A0A7J7MB37_9MAGN|nr:hypothetical protein GIB67_010542 [Kingdonia uniflora]
MKSHKSMDYAMDFPTPSCPDSVEFRSPIPSEAMMSILTSIPLESVGHILCDVVYACLLGWNLTHKGPLENIRESIRHIRSSQYKQQRFFDACKTLNIKTRKLPLDIQFRWNATYLMLDAAIPYQKKYANDAYYTLLFESMKCKYIKYWGDILIVLGLASCMDPSYKFNILELCLEINYGCEAIESMMEIYKTKLKDLFEEYQRKFCNDECDPSVAVPSLIDGDDMVLALLSKRRASLSQGCVSDLQRHLDQIPIKVSSKDTIDLLNWWKTNEGTYPILTVMAQYLLTIPISTIAYESAFSTGEQVLSKYRSCLLPETVKALICLKDWFQAEGLQDEDLHDLEDLMGDMGL